MTGRFDVSIVLRGPRRTKSAPVLMLRDAARMTSVCVTSL